MTDQARPDPRSADPAPRRKPRLYHRVLSLGVAAVIAATLPFSVLYADALHHHQAATPTVAVTDHGGRQVVTTRTSGGALVRTTVPAGAAVTTPAQTAAPQPPSSHPS